MRRLHNAIVRARRESRKADESIDFDLIEPQTPAPVPWDVTAAGRDEDRAIDDHHSTDRVSVGLWTATERDDLPGESPDVEDQRISWATRVSVADDEQATGVDVMGGTPRKHVRGRGFAALVGLLLFVALAVYGLNTATSTSTGETFDVYRGTIHRVIAGRGRIEPFAELRISASTIGRIQAILVNEGQEVREGQILARMEAADVRAQLAQAEAQLEEASAKYAEVEAGPRPQELESARARDREASAVLLEANTALERMRALLAGGLTSNAQLDEAERRRAVAEAQYQTAQQQLSLVESGSREEVRRAALAQLRRAEADAGYARAMLDETVVRAPVSGKILRRYMQPGEVIALQRPQPIVTLADVSRIQVRAEIDETDARLLRVGQPVEVTANAIAGRVFKGTVTEIGSTAGRKSMLSEDPAEPVDTKVVEAIIVFAEPYPWTLGTSVEVGVVVEHRENVPVVPQSAVQQVNGRSVVVLREGQSDIERPVRTGASDEDYVEIVAGLKEGDVVIRR